MTIASCLGDVNIDGVVDVTDILESLGVWGPCSPWTMLEVRKNGQAAAGPPR